MTSELIRRLAPACIDDLWADDSGEDIPIGGLMDPGSLAHVVAERLFDWAQEEDVEALLRDEIRLNKLVVEVADAAFQLGFNSQQLKPDGTLVASCDGCNNPYDAGFCTHQDTDSQRVLIDLRSIGPRNHAIVSRNLHRAVKLFAVTAHLLSKKNSYQLAALMTPEPPAGMSAESYVRQIAGSGQRGFCCVLQLFALLDNASEAFPKAAVYAAACLSLTVSQRPSQAFALLDPERMAPALQLYMKQVYRLVHNSNCLVEEKFGVAAFINVLPLLYCFGDWNNIHEPIQQCGLASWLTPAILNILFSIDRAKHDEDDRVDVAHDFDNLPPLRSACFFIDPRIKSNLLREHPLSWAVVAGLEVLAKWASRGIPVTTDTIMNNETGRREPVSDHLQDALPWMESICDQARPIAIQLTHHLVEGTCTRNMFDDDDASRDFLLSNRMLKLARRCVLCGKSMKVANSCAGGCLGLARYCSKEHQKEHWRQHKYFCKLNQR